MTAIAGFWSLDDRPDAASACERMLKSQQIYGPQAPAMASDGAITVGQRLFGLLPEDRRKQRVASGADAATLLVADARLDNRDELCGALGIHAGEGPGLSDSALILRALERWDEGAVERLQGDFAFAFWDSRRRRLLLARDFMGQQPLHYARGSGFFAFASMPKGLHALPEIPAAPDREAVAGFLALMPEDGSETFFKGIEKVRAGEMVAVTRDGIRATRWWQPALRPLGLKRPEDYAEALREHFDRAVAARLRGAGNKVASHLSGGLDSGAVAATAARLMAPGGGRVTAYTGVPREGYDSSGVGNAFADEGPHAAQVAAMYPNMDHVLVPNGGSPIADLDRLFFVYERPVLNLCNGVWMHRIMDRARERGLPILLSGARGNMSFSYDGMPLLTQLLSSGPAGQARAGIPGSGAQRHTGRNRRRPGARSLSCRCRCGMRSAGCAARAEALPNIPRLAPTRSASCGSPSVPPKGASTSATGRAATRSRLGCGRFAGSTRGNYNKGHLAGWGVDVRDPYGGPPADRVLPGRPAGPVSARRDAASARPGRLRRPAPGGHRQRDPQRLSGGGLARRPDRRSR
jgi:asparagine synthase (glutamine-hydrolysing)